MPVVDWNSPISCRKAVSRDSTTFSVHNWTTEDVELWLKDVVGLPQYLPIFRKFKIDGNFLPRWRISTYLCRVVCHVVCRMVCCIVCSCSTYSSSYGLWVVFYMVLVQFVTLEFECSLLCGFGVLIFWTNFRAKLWIKFGWRLQFNVCTGDDNFRFFFEWSLHKTETP